MKKLLLIILIAIVSEMLIAQVPESINYQAIPRDGGAIYPEQEMYVRINILSGSTAGSSVYTETFDAITTALGLLNLQIGQGTPVSGDFSIIDWGANSYFLKVEIDPAGGTSYVEMGTTQLLSVPYALHAKTADMTTGDSIWKQSANNIYYNGNVGIGTDNPLYPVHIVSPLISGPETLFKASVADDPNSFFEIGNATISDGKFMPAIISHNGTDHRQSLFVLAKTTDDLDDMGGYPVISFDARRMEGPIINRSLFQWGSAGNIKMTMLASGNVGIGTTTPSERLSVNGVIESTTGGVKFPDGTVQTKAPTSYSIGDFARGGIVFWVDETGQRGLVCAIEDQDGGSGMRWFNGSFTYTEALGDGVYAGEMNTMLIIANQGNSSANYAAGVCANYTVDQNSTTYGDWYLPSKEELNLMHQNKSTIDATAGANSGSAFASANYWSSTEINDYDSWIQYFGNGSQGGSGKGYTMRVRAVRAF